MAAPTQEVIDKADAFIELCRRYLTEGGNPRPGDGQEWTEEEDEFLTVSIIIYGYPAMGNSEVNWNKLTTLLNEQFADVPDRRPRSRDGVRFQAKRVWDERYPALLATQKGPAPLITIDWTPAARATDNNN